MKLSKFTEMKVTPKVYCVRDLVSYLSLVLGLGTRSLIFTYWMITLLSQVFMRILSPRKFFVLAVRGPAAYLSFALNIYSRSLGNAYTLLKAILNAEHIFTPIQRR